MAEEDRIRAELAGETAGVRGKRAGQKSRGREEEGGSQESSQESR